MQANSEYPDLTPRSAAYGLGLHCSHMSHKKDARLIWVKLHSCIFRGVSSLICVLVLCFTSWRI